MDNDLPDDPDTFDGPDSPEDDLATALTRVVASAPDRESAIGTLTHAAAEVCSALAAESYRWEDWADEEDREFAAHLMLTTARLCGLLTYGVGLLAGQARDEAWALLAGAAACRTELIATLWHDEPVDAETSEIAALLDAADAAETPEQLEEISLELDGPPAGMTATRVAVTARARLRRTPDLFLDEDVFDERHLRWTLDLVHEALADLADLGERWSVEQLVRLRDAVSAADATRASLFPLRGPSASV